jgi:hypothetical protein
MGDQLNVRALVVGGLALCAAALVNAQERAANGQIYGELLPFVGLGGVRIQVFGIGGAVYNVPVWVAKPILRRRRRD